MTYPPTVSPIPTQLAPFVDSLLTSLATNVTVPNAIAAIIGLTSAPLYVLQLFILFRHWKKFKSSFFLLFILRAIIALLNMLFSYVGQRFIKFGWFLPLYQQSPLIVLATFYFFIYYPFLVENLVTFFLVLNRLSSVVSLLKYEKLWTKRRTTACVLFSCLAPLPFTFHIFQYHVYVNEIDSYGGIYQLSYASMTDSKKLWGLITGDQLFGPIYASNNFVSFVESCLVMTACVVMNVYTLYFYKKQQNMKNYGQNFVENKERVERKLTMYVLITFLGQFLISLYMILWYVVSSPLKEYFDVRTYDLANFAIQNQGPWVNDLCSIGLPSWMMLWANDRMRLIISRICLNAVIFVKRLFGNKKMQPVPIFAVSQQQPFVVTSQFKRPSLQPKEQPVLAATSSRIPPASPYKRASLEPQVPLGISGRTNQGAPFKRASLPSQHPRQHQRAMASTSSRMIQTARANKHERP